MAVRLPTPAEAHLQHKVDLDADGAVWVVFIIRPISASKYSEILDEAAAGKADGEFVSTNDIAVQIIAAGVVSLYSSENNTPEKLDAPDAVLMATEVWTTWPTWARSSLFDAIKSYSLEGPSPKGSTPSGIAAG